ncbi:Os06g0631001 [Oryza sativa Japonica Group]|uniref:Os06g0631001 protein n=1 Tax=Oryza sativa subsp. japonica TaxID=39947 RepID=C7J420_ORYSJ|nr:Os06g0631001 [Oryza sativa Japonica Group]|eukprot:NP_001174916.1 Os06g0631001 [Oryza sativa Japonica Group]
MAAPVLHPRAIEGTTTQLDLHPGPSRAPPHGLTSFQAASPAPSYGAASPSLAVTGSRVAENCNGKR